MARARGTDTRQRIWRSESIDLSVAHAGDLVELPRGLRALSFAFPAGSPAIDSLFVAIAVLDSAKALPALTQVVDPVAIPDVNLDAVADELFIYCPVGGLGALTMRVYGCEGTFISSQANRLAAAIVANPPAAAAVPIVWQAPAAVAINPGPTSIIAANANRQALTIQNTGTVNVAVRPAAAAAVFANDIILRPGDSWTEPQAGRLIYRGEFRGITAGGAGEVRAVEAI
jgi:hypothetical protein